MRRNLLFKNIVLFVTMLMFSFWASAAQIFVSDVGSDTGTGTESNPYLTIQHAIDVAANGDEVIEIGRASCRERV